LPKQVLQETVHRTEIVVSLALWSLHFGGVLLAALKECETKLTHQTMVQTVYQLETAVVSIVVNNLGFCGRHQKMVQTV
jgi:hypothetical protein